MKPIRRSLVRLRRLFAAALQFAALAGGSAFAAERVVTDFTDDPANPAPGSLRAVLAAAQPGDVVRFGSPLLVPLAADLRVTVPSLTIRGPGGISRPAGASGGGSLRVAADGVTLDDVEIRDAGAVFQSAAKRGRIAGAAVRGCRLTGRGGVLFLRCDAAVADSCAVSVDHGPDADAAAASAIFAMEVSGLSVTGCTGSARGARFVHGVSVHDVVLRSDTVAGGVELVVGLPSKGAFPTGTALPGTATVEDCNLGTGALRVYGTLRNHQTGPLTVRRVRCATVRVWGASPTVEDVTAVEGVPSTTGTDEDRTRLLADVIDVSNQNRAGDVVVRRNFTTAGRKGIAVQTDRRVASCTIEDNVVTGAADLGIHVVSAARAAVLRRCKVSGGDAHGGWTGILATGGKRAPLVVEGNEVSDGPGIGIRVVQEDPGLVLRDNRVKGCRGFGIFVQRTAQAEIEGGSVEGTAAVDQDAPGAGIGIDRGPPSSVEGVKLTGNEGPGVFLDERALARIARVECSGNGGAGIDLLPLGVTPNTAQRLANLGVEYPEDLKFDGATGKLTGRTRPGATVEVFAVEGGARAGNPQNGEGAAYLGTATAGADGAFTWPEGEGAKCPASGKLTATATVALKGRTVTSEFSEDVDCESGPPVQLVSRSSAGVPGDGDSTTVPYLGSAAPAGHGSAGSGRWVAFASAASNLTADPHLPGSTHVYRHDALDGTTTLVTKTFDGGAFESDLNLVGFRAGDTPSISDDGRYVAFVARSRRVVQDDFDDKPTVVLHDAQTGTNTAVTDPRLYASPRLPSGAAAKGGGDYCSISGDGSAVAFLSVGMDWDAIVETYADEDYFVWTRATNTFERVSTTDAGVEVPNPYSLLPVAPRLSHDARYCVFASMQTLTPSNTVTGLKVFLRDRQNRTTEIVSVDSSGSARTGNSPLISDDGRYVAFVSKDALVAGDTNGIEDVYLRDRQAQTVTRLSLQPDGTQFPASMVHAYTPTMSADARRVAFVAQGQFLSSSGVLTKAPRTYVLDRDDGVVVEVTGPGGAIRGSVLAPALSRDGGSLVFVSSAPDLVPAVTTTDVDHVYLMRLPPP